MKGNPNSLNVDAVCAAIEVALTETRPRGACPELSEAVDRALVGSNLWWDFLLSDCQRAFGPLPDAPQLPYAIIRIHLVCFAAPRVGGLAHETCQANVSLDQAMQTTAGGAQ